MSKLLLSIVLALTSCGKGDPVKCDTGCRNFATLMFWDKADKEIAALPTDKQEAARKQKLAELAKNLEGGMNFCISKCQAANNDDQIDCLVNAKTAPEVKACASDD